MGFRRPNAHSVRWGVGPDRSPGRQSVDRLSLKQLREFVRSDARHERNGPASRYLNPLKLSTGFDASVTMPTHI